MQPLIFIIIVLILTNCSYPPENVVAKEKVDTTSSEQVLSDAVNYYFNNPIRDMNNFSFKVNNHLIDSLNYLFTTNKSFQVVVKTNLCGGDCCTSFKKMTNNKKNTTFCFFKTDCGEHGFSNDQFFLSNDNLNIVRNFNLYICSTDSSKTLWYIEEKLFLFRKDKVIIRERRKLTDSTSFTLGNIPFKETYGDFIKLTKEKTDEYNKLLMTENIEE